ncbi:MAG: hypothetical protein EA422_10805 [Gemmatimonadales bacterium]|nr:MAG: hypothetical protein EA422_10805 [Gemmatimonadales bacterium]
MIRLGARRALRFVPGMHRVGKGVHRVGTGMRRVGTGMVLAASLVLAVAGPAQGQELADFDYENLSFRGAGLDFGYMTSSRVESTGTFGARADLGFLGPGVRVTAGFTRWSSFLKGSEVRTLEERVEELILEQTGTDTQVDLGRISWSDVAFHADAHVLWRVPAVGIYTYAGAGATAHVLRGGGEAIEDTFVEDLLDSIRAGLNIHGGVEMPLHPRFRVYGESRFEFMENLRYLQVKVGGQFMIGDAP